MSDVNLTALPYRAKERVQAEVTLLADLADRVFFDLETPHRMVEGSMLIGLLTDLNTGELDMLWVSTGITGHGIVQMAEVLERYGRSRMEEDGSGTD